jgi:hypothetical protein
MKEKTIIRFEFFDAGIKINYIIMFIKYNISNHVEKNFYESFNKFYESQPLGQESNVGPKFQCSSFAERL